MIQNLAAFYAFGLMCNSRFENKNVVRYYQTYVRLFFVQRSTSLTEQDKWRTRNTTANGLGSFDRGKAEALEKRQQITKHDSRPMDPPLITRYPEKKDYLIVFHI